MTANDVRPFPALAWRRQREERGGDVRRFLDEVGPLSPGDLVAVLLADQGARWDAGDRAPAEDYLAAWPVLIEEREYAVEMVYGEFLLRARRGEAPALDEYHRRFPDYAESLNHLVELRRALGPPDDAPAQPSAALPCVPGYEVLEELGRGGMGVVYKARQTSLGRLLALKVVGELADAEALRRFRTEAEAAARLRHPNVVQIYDVGAGDGRPYIAMEYVEGGTLQTRLGGRPLPPPQAAALVETLARAMRHAHDQGVIHRDLKPANVLMAAGGLAGAKPPAAIPKIADFGLAKRLDADDGQTKTGALFGTPSYMAPEQAEGCKDVGPAADVYALGAILYEVLTGRPPFQAASPLQTLDLVRACEPVPPARLNATVPRDLEAVCLKCLEKDPHRRYATAEDLADDLGRFLDRRPVRARLAGPARRAGKWCRRNPVVATLLGLLSAAAVGLTALSLRAEDARAEARREQTRAEEEARNAREQKGRAEAAAAEADRRRRDAEDLRDQVQRLLTEAIGYTQSFPRQPAEVRRLTVKMLGGVANRILELLARQPEDPGLRRLLAVVLCDRGTLHFDNNDRLTARADFLKARDLLEPLVQELPKEERARVTLACLYTWLGRERAAAGDGEEAIIAYRRSLAMRHDLVKERPTTQERLDLFFVQGEFASFLAQRGRPTEAEPLFVEAVAVYGEQVHKHPSDYESRGRLIGILHNWGDAYLKNGQPDKARACRERADALARGDDDRDVRRAEAKRLEALSVSLRQHGQLAEALAPAEDGARTLQRLCDEQPRDAGLWTEQSNAWNVVGKARWALGQRDEAVAALRTAADAQRQAVEWSLNSLAAREHLSLRLGHLWEKLCAARRFDEAAENLREQERLWPGDAKRLAEIAKDWKTQAESVGDGCDELTPGERARREEYLAESRRLAALANAPGERGRVSAPSAKISGR